MNRRLRRYSPAKLRQQIIAAGLTQGQVADALGVSLNYVARLCSGNRRMNERTARALAYTLDIEVRELEDDDHVQD